MGRRPLLISRDVQVSLPLQPVRHSGPLQQLRHSGPLQQVRHSGPCVWIASAFCYHSSMRLSWQPLTGAHPLFFSIPLYQLLVIVANRCLPLCLQTCSHTVDPELDMA